MNYEEKLLEYLETMESGIEKAVDFSAEQAPLVIQEYLTWMFWESIIAGTALLLAAIGAWILLRIIYWATKEASQVDKEMARSIAWGIAFLANIIVLPFSGLNYMIALKVVVAPRVIILEKLAELVG